MKALRELNLCMVSEKWASMIKETGVLRVASLTADSPILMVIFLFWRRWGDGAVLKSFVFCETLVWF
jgi:hypothetical protein